MWVYHVCVILDLRIRPEDSARFSPGQLVCHKRYGYRGVVADLDSKCMADDAWYVKNQTQPVRNQPWYHVLVDGSDATTYAAQENLEPDHSGEPVSHPLVQRIFVGFEGGRYILHEDQNPD